jgi:hypothetical protein
VLLDTDTDTETSGGSTTTVSFRPLVRVDPRTGEVTERAEVGDDARALTAGEGAAWVVERATGDVPSGSWRLTRAVP